MKFATLEHIYSPKLRI